MARGQPDSAEAAAPPAKRLQRPSTTLPQLCCNHCIACVSKEDYGARRPHCDSLHSLGLFGPRLRSLLRSPVCWDEGSWPRPPRAVCILAEVLRAKDAQQRSAYLKVAGPSLEAELAKVLR